MPNVATLTAELRGRDRGFSSTMAGARTSMGGLAGGATTLAGRLGPLSIVAGTAATAIAGVGVAAARGVGQLRELAEVVGEEAGLARAFGIAREEYVRLGLAIERTGQERDEIRDLLGDFQELLGLVARGEEREVKLLAELGIDAMAARRAVSDLDGEFIRFLESVGQLDRVAQRGILSQLIGADASRRAVQAVDNIDTIRQALDQPLVFATEEAIAELVRFRGATSEAGIQLRESLIQGVSDSGLLRSLTGLTGDFTMLAGAVNPVTVAMSPLALATLELNRQFLRAVLGADSFVDFLVNLPAILGIPGGELAAGIARQRVDLLDATQRANIEQRIRTLREQQVGVLGNLLTGLLGLSQETERQAQGQERLARSASTAADRLDVLSDLDLTLGPVGLLGGESQSTFQRSLEGAFEGGGVRFGETASDILRRAFDTLVRTAPAPTDEDLRARALRQAFGQEVDTTGLIARQNAERIMRVQAEEDRLTEIRLAGIQHVATESQAAIRGAITGIHSWEDAFLAILVNIITQFSVSQSAAGGGLFGGILGRVFGAAGPSSGGAGGRPIVVQQNLRVSVNTDGIRDYVDRGDARSVADSVSVTTEQIEIPNSRLNLAVRTQAEPDD